MIKALLGFAVAVLFALSEIVLWVAFVFIKRLEKRAQRESERDSGGDL